MKKLLIFLLGLFITLTVLNTGNVSYAQGNGEEPQGYNAGISNNRSCLTGMGKGCFSYDNLIRSGNQIEGKNKHKTVTTIAQDVILAATYMVGTVLTIVIIYCGLMYIFAARGGKDVKNYKNGLVNAAIGAILVRGAYAIVRLIQYIAKG